MSLLPYHKRYHSDALNGMLPLSLEERGAYNTLLDLMYDRGGPLIDNERLLAGYMNCSTRKWRQILEQLIEKGKIYITKDGMIANSRALKELESAAKTQRKLIEAGAKGGRIRAENENLSNEINESGQASLEPASSQPQANRAFQKLEEKDKDKSLSKKTPLPDDWEPGEFGEGTQSRAIVGGWSELELQRQLERFRAHHRKEGSKFVDWQSAWSTWVLNSERFAGRDMERGGSRPNGGGQPKSLVDQVLEEKERRERRERAAAVPP